MEDELKLIVLSALVHDIGKFAGSAKDCPENLENEYPARFKEKPGNQYPLHTRYFVENNLPLPAELNQSRHIIARMASLPDMPDDQQGLSEKCLMIADYLSSGRRTDEEPEAPGDFQETRLVSVFDRVELFRHNFKPPGNAFHKLAPLETDTDNIFPKADQPGGGYAELFRQFLAALGQLDTNLSFHFFLDGLISVLEKYTWCIPSSSHDSLSDISLFDHAFSTAGIAQALFMHHWQNSTVPGFEDEEDKFILLEGDLSGIQEYIFDISRESGRGVSKIFRARSFYLQALTKSVLIEIQRRLGLFPVCRLADSGGKFIILAPVTDKIQSQANTLDRDIQLWFLKKFKGRLSMNLSELTPMSQKDFLPANFQEKIEAAGQSLEQSRSRKLNLALKQNGPVISEDYDEREEGICSICGINASDESSTRLYKEKEYLDDELGISVCQDCCDQIVYIGTKLPDTQYLVYDNKKGRIPLFRDLRLSLMKNEPQDLNGVIHVETLTDRANFSRTRLARYLPRITKDELVNEKWFDLFVSELEDQKIKPDQPKTFSIIAHKSKKQGQDQNDQNLVGRSLLGFFKADVDNLGLIFSLGLQNRLSAARFSSLSRMMNLFFSEYLVDLAKKEHPDIYVVFAGGDDLFLAGPWNHVIEFAVTLRKKLAEFCAQNPDITMSGGILPAKPRLPMRKAAELVEEQLENAKKHKTEDRLKDSVCFLDEVLSWEDLEKLTELGKQFDRAVEDKERTNFTTGFLFRLLQYHKMYRKFIHEKQIQFGRYLALAHYDIGRNIRSEKRDNKKELEMLDRIFAVGVSERPELEKLNIPLFYAISRNRQENY